MGGLAALARLQGPHLAPAVARRLAAAGNLLVDQPRQWSRRRRPKGLGAACQLLADLPDCCAPAASWSPPSLRPPIAPIPRPPGGWPRSCEDRSTPSTAPTTPAPL